MATVKQVQREGYVAEVGYSTKDGCYYAQVINAPGLNLLMKAVADDGFGLI